MTSTDLTIWNEPFIKAQLIMKNDKSKFRVLNQFHLLHTRASCNPRYGYTKFTI